VLMPAIFEEVDSNGTIRFGFVLCAELALPGFCVGKISHLWHRHGLAVCEGSGLRSSPLCLDFRLTVSQRRCAPDTRR